MLLLFTVVVLIVQVCFYQTSVGYMKEISFWFCVLAGVCLGWVAAFQFVEWFPKKD